MNEKKKIEQKENSLACRVIAQGQGEDPNYIPGNIDDILEDFMESEEDLKLLPSNYQENRLQLSNLEKQ